MTSKIKPKEKLTNLFIRNVDVATKNKFVKKAKALGYRPREFFAKIVEKL